MVLKKWQGGGVLLAAALMLVAFGACSNSSGDSGPSVSARYESSDVELTFYDDNTFVLADVSKAAAVARAIGKTITGTYTGDPNTGKDLELTASDGTKITATVSGNTLAITVGSEKYELTKKSGGSTSSSASMKLPASVGTNPLTAASYSAESGWGMSFAAKVSVILAGFYPDEWDGEVDCNLGYVTVEDGTLVEGLTEHPTVLNYSYDSGKRELYVQLSKAYLGNNGGKDYYGGKEAYVGIEMADKADFWEGQEDKLEELADKIFSVVHTYSYEKDESTGVITLTSNDAGNVTLTPEEK